jgi:hypothetical protein
MNTSTKPTTNTVSRREKSQRFTSLGLAAVMTLSILTSIEMMATGPVQDSLLAQQGHLVVSAPASASSPQV